MRTNYNNNNTTISLKNDKIKKVVSQSVVLLTAFLYIMSLGPLFHTSLSLPQALSLSLTLLSHCLTLSHTCLSLPLSHCLPLPLSVTCFLLASLIPFSQTCPSHRVLPRFPSPLTYSPPPSFTLPGIRRPPPPPVFTFPPFPSWC